MEKKLSPWFWIPTLYFAQGIPYFIVNNISVMMFTKMGVPNGDMAMFTSLLYLPWMIKPFWSPFVDIFKTKRWWTVVMQILMTIAFAFTIFFIPTPTAEMLATQSTPISMFYVTLILFVDYSSTTCVVPLLSQEKANKFDAFNSCLLL
jgi:PAT family beta-lactamase induction signal transducer AmpG